MSALAVGWTPLALAAWAAANTTGVARWCLVPSPMAPNFGFHSSRACRQCLTACGYVASGSGDPGRALMACQWPWGPPSGFGGSLSGRYNSAACRLMGDYAAVGLSRRPGSGQLVVGTGPLIWDWLHDGHAVRAA